MPGFFFRPVDLSSLAFFLVALFVSRRLATLRPRTYRNRWLTAFFISSALFALFSIVANARMDTWSYYAIHLQIVTSALGTFALIQYAYLVGTLESEVKESRLLLILSSVALLYILGWAIYQFSQLTPRGDPTTNTVISEGLIGIGLLWTLVVALRQLRHRDQNSNESPPVGHLSIMLTGLLLLLLANSLQFFQGIFPSFEPRSVFTIYTISIGVILIGFNYFLHWDSANTRINRIIGAALLLLQSVFAVLSILFGLQLNAQPRASTYLDDSYFQLVPKENRGYQLNSVNMNILDIGSFQLVDGNYQIQSDFPIVFFDKEYSNLLVTRGRLVFAENWSAQKANFYLQPHIYVIDFFGNAGQPLTTAVAQSPQEIVIRWSLPDEGLAQIIINRNGLIQIGVKQLASQPLQRWSISAGKGLQGVDFLLEYPPPEGQLISNAGILFESSFATLLDKDAWARPILIVQFIVSLSVLVILYAVRGRLIFLDRQLASQTLNERQLEIASMVASGKSNAEIGDALSITENTVKYHLKQIFQALQIDSRAALSEWFRQKM